MRPSAGIYCWVTGSTPAAEDPLAKFLGLYYPHTDVALLVPLVL